MPITQHVSSQLMQSNAKRHIKGIIKICVTLASLALVIFMVLKIVIVPKTPATAEQVWRSLTSYEFKPQDITQLYFENSENFKLSLTQCYHPALRIRFIPLKS